jgi:hypothetical protein
MGIRVKREPFFTKLAVFVDQLSLDPEEAIYTARIGEDLRVD